MVATIVFLQSRHKVSLLKEFVTARVGNARAALAFPFAVHVFIMLPDIRNCTAARGRSVSKLEIELADNVRAVPGVLFFTRQAHDVQAHFLKHLFDGKAGLAQRLYEFLGIKTVAA